MRKLKSWIPLYPDFLLTPDGLERFLQYAIPDARQPRPDYVYQGDEVPTLVTYPDRTIGPSRKVFDAQACMEEND